MLIAIITPSPHNKNLNTTSPHSRLTLRIVGIQNNSSSRLNIRIVRTKNSSCSCLNLRIVNIKINFSPRLTLRIVGIQNNSSSCLNIRIVRTKNIHITSFSHLPWDSPCHTEVSGKERLRGVDPFHWAI